MDFFHQQDLAKRNTKLLVGLLILAVIVLIAITTVFTAIFIHYFHLGTGVHLQAAEQNTSLLHAWLSNLSWDLLLKVSAVIVATVVGASLFRAFQLKRGGEAVASSLNGQLLNADNANAQQKVLLNVVEEMAIASGMPVPTVYVFDQPGINAFAAGYQPTDAVIGITQGALDSLNREQLQGVIAHEFSHILHGDMRLNLKMVSLLNGILIIGLIGQMILRGSHTGYRSSSSRRNGGRAALLGLGFIIIGYVGTLFGKIIAAATSRQREFLADASAVQYTRNPNGIAGALDAIAHQSSMSSSRWQHKNAAEFSHMFFSMGISNKLGRLFATHPPIQERITRVAPRFVPSPRTKNQSNERDSTFSDAAPNTSSNSASNAETTSSFANAVNSEADVSALNNEPVIAGLNEITPQALNTAHMQLQALPMVLAEACHNIFSARAIIYGLLLHSATPAEREKMMEYLADKSHPAVFKQLQKLAEQTANLSPDNQWLLLLKSLPQLRQLSVNQQRIFVTNVKQLIEQDKQVTVFEWCLFTLIKQTISPSQANSKNLSTAQLHKEISELLSFVLYQNNAAQIDYQGAFNSATQALKHCQLLDRSSVSLIALSKSLRKLQNLAPLEKPKLLKAVAELMHADNNLCNDEMLMLKTLALCLDTPPPMVEGLLIEEHKTTA